MIAVVYTITLNDLDKEDMSYTSILLVILNYHYQFVFSIVCVFVNKIIVKMLEEVAFHIKQLDI